MDARLTDEQAMLRTLADEIGGAVGVRSAAELQSADAVERSRRAWGLLVDAGLVGLGTPQDIGGVGGSTVDAVLVTERLAAHLSPAPFIGAAVWVPAIVAAAGAAEVLEPVVYGSSIIVPVLADDLSDLAGSGLAVDASMADGALGMTSTGDVLLVELGDAVESVDLTRPIRRSGSVTRQVGVLTRDAVDRVQALGLVLVAADLVGVMAAALDDAVAHVAVRRQFDRPVGSFQAVQHLAAHVAMQVEAARSSLWRAAWAVDAAPPADALLLARQAKAWASAAAIEVGEAAIQMLGGIAFTWEMTAHLRQRRILLSRALLGDENLQYDRIADMRLVGA